MRNHKNGKIQCDVCRKFYDTLGHYGGAPDWAVCFRCFEKANAMAAKKDRWPNAEDFAALVVRDE